MQIERPLSIKEIKFLTQDLKRLDKRKKNQVKFLVGWTLLAVIIGSIVFFRLDTTNELYLLIGTVIVYLLIGVWSFSETYLKHKKEQKNIDFVFSDNKVKSIKVEATEYIELSEIEGEGVHYLFQLKDNKILSIGGQNFYPTKHFPSDNFEIAICYGPNDEIIFFETYNYGNKIQPKTKITGQQKWDLIGNPNYPNPDSFTILEGQLENIEIIINRK